MQARNSEMALDDHVSGEFAGRSVAQILVKAAPHRGLKARGRVQPLSGSHCELKKKLRVAPVPIDAWTAFVRFVSADAELLSSRTGSDVETGEEDY